MKMTRRSLLFNYLGLGDHLYGPYSWSDMLALAATIIAYGALRQNKPYEAELDNVLALVKEQAIRLCEGKQ